MSAVAGEARESYTMKECEKNMWVERNLYSWTRKAVGSDVKDREARTMIETSIVERMLRNVLIGVPLLGSTTRDYESGIPFGNQRGGGRCMRVLEWILGKGWSLASKKAKVRACGNDEVREELSRVNFEGTLWKRYILATLTRLLSLAVWATVSATEGMWVIWKLEGVNSDWNTGRNDCRMQSSKVYIEMLWCWYLQGGWRSWPGRYGVNLDRRES